VKTAAKKWLRNAMVAIVAPSNALTTAHHRFPRHRSGGVSLYEYVSAK